MQAKIKSIRTFIGSNNFSLSRAFYQDFGFTETVIVSKMSYFEMQGFGFYLQDYYVKDWVNNLMVFLEVEDLVKVHEAFMAKDLISKYSKVRISKIQNNDWGNEFFVHDPMGVLWHIGCFY